MSHFECHLNRRFWRPKKVVQVKLRGGEGNLDKIQKNFFRETVPYIGALNWEYQNHSKIFKMIQGLKREYQNHSAELLLKKYLKKSNSQIQHQWHLLSCLLWVSRETDKILIRTLIRELKKYLVKTKLYINKNVPSKIILPPSAS